MILNSPLFFKITKNHIYSNSLSEALQDEYLKNKNMFVVNYTC